MLLGWGGSASQGGGRSGDLESAPVKKLTQAILHSTISWAMTGININKLLDP